LLGFNDSKHNGLFDTRIGIDAYRKNVIVYRCVNLIAQSASHVPWLVMKRNSTEIVKNHPIHNLLKKPNPEKAGADFFGEIIASKLLFGNAYILSTSHNNLPPKEIYLLHAPATEIVFDYNFPIAYKYNSTSGEKLYPIDKISRVSKVLHLKNYNPINQHYGLSCLDAASMPIELHLHATNWNSSLLKNGARPSGALIVKDSNGYLSDEQFERL
jgi:HK97 family phage portal protein